MTTEKLIIDGVDHAKFDLEWAKRGGVVVITDAMGEAREQTLGKYISNEEAFEYYSAILIGIGEEMYYERMATPAECEAAGVEYIEYHGWRPIESAPKNGAIILIRHENDIFEGQPIIMLGVYSDNGFFDYYDSTYVDSDPTHWMPLPQTPKDE